MERYPTILECEGVYPPREDSYLLFKSVQVKEGERFLDIGTGTGIMAIGAALHGAEAYATDISEKALKCARENGKKNGVELEIIRADMLNGIKGKFDAVVFNPPYLPESGMEYELKDAIESPERGSAHIKEFIGDVSRVLKDGGRVYFVASSHTDTNVFKTENIEKIAEKPMFFERLYVFMISHKKDL